jgi:hypothetical protein
MQVDQTVELKLTLGTIQYVMSGLAQLNQVRVALGLPQDLAAMRTLIVLAEQLPKPPVVQPPQSDPG